MQPVEARRCTSLAKLACVASWTIEADPKVLQELHGWFLLRMLWDGGAVAVQGKRRLVGTGVAATELGVDPATLWRWAKAGVVEPELRTAGGHLRWDLESLRRQIDALPDEVPGEPVEGSSPASEG